MEGKNYAKDSYPTIIMGAGLTGLRLASLLSKRGEKYLILEARDRPGGRVRTTRTEEGTTLELGATWFGEKHTALTGLLNELELDRTAQHTGETAIYQPRKDQPAQLVHLPANDAPSYRVAGGSDAIVRALLATIPQENIALGQAVVAVRKSGPLIEVDTVNTTYRANKVVSTLPPRLLMKTVKFDPALPAELATTASRTHTWMGDSIKVGLRYPAPFWLADGAPGATVFANEGPVTELYDHSDAANNSYALKGFMDGAHHAATRAQRRDMMLAQLRGYYGAAVDAGFVYEEAVWRDESFTFVAYDGYVAPHQHNGAAVFRQPIWNGQFYLAGSETAADFPGYMDGAIRSADWVAARLADQHHAI
ncbi:flavin monoamine oxidase family protein [Neolewinella antarctica]|uniref:Monoamine oxidase n=1 Tax=Neolewinella antarctica TaxID=442734 RepID=A0ABX0X7T4_9BACT|nr:FAD-dependent oxidoreductase [Neolewinella antarctica]NJC25115.1 monoamine oxidase [Neolewinella antarctica]